MAAIIINAREKYFTQNIHPGPLHSITPVPCAFIELIVYTGMRNLVTDQCCQVRDFIPTSRDFLNQLGFF